MKYGNWGPVHVGLQGLKAHAPEKDRYSDIISQGVQGVPSFPR